MSPPVAGDHADIPGATFLGTFESEFRGTAIGGRRDDGAGLDRPVEKGPSWRSPRSPRSWRPRMSAATASGNQQVAGGGMGKDLGPLEDRLAVEDVEHGSAQFPAELLDAAAGLARLAMSVA